MKLKLRQSVRHSKYGWGTVLELEGNQTTVYFCSVGIRKFPASQAVFQVVEDQGARKKPGG
jgi:hypothetical protein